MPSTIVINGETHQLDLPDQMPLLWVLRDALGKTGTKYGCGIGSCGACTVHIEGQAVRACQVALADVWGSVTTIEGLSPEGRHPLQQAWRDLDVPQCGYCQAGQLMAAAALLERTPNPTDDDIDSAMNRNLCRCGTYIRIRAGIHRAAERMATADGANDGNGEGA